MKQFHFLFGYNKPKYTVHFLERYAERFYNVKKENALSWIKFHDKIREITSKIYNSKLYDEKNAKEILKRYGMNVKFLLYKKTIFVVKNNIEIVTCYKNKE